MKNYRDEAELERRKNGEPWFFEGETHGLSVFFLIDEDVFHTYSTYARSSTPRQPSKTVAIVANESRLYPLTITGGY